MRPIELSLRDFRSYSGEHKFDFRDRRLIAIVGPTGAGKSTILDAITFALYASTPRTGKRNSSSLINQRAVEAMVRLRFEADGAEWEATRSIRRKGGNQYALSRYDANSAEPAERLIMAEDVNKKVKELLGLDYDAFTRSVLLAQGKFAEFLQATPAKKTIVLRGLLSYDKLDEMQKLARQRSTDAELKIVRLDGQLKIIEEAKNRSAELQDELKSAQSRHQQLQSIRPQFQELNEQMREIQDEMNAARKKRDNIKGLRLPDQTKSEKIILDAEQAATKIKEAEAQLEEANQKFEAADQSLKSPEFQKRLKRFTEADRLVFGLPKLEGTVKQANNKLATARQHQEQVAGGLEQSRGDLAKAKKQLLQDEEADRNAKQMLDLADKALLVARHQDMAAELRSGLEEGGDCPVCEQPVHEVPVTVTDSDVEKAEKDYEQAKSAREKAAENLTNAKVAQKEIAVRVDAADKNLKTARAQAEAASQEHTKSQQGMDQCLARLEELLGAGNPQARLEQEKAAVGAIQDEANQAGAERNRDTRALKETRSAGEGAQKELIDLWNKLANLAPQLGVEVSGIAQDPQATQQLLTLCQVERTRIISELDGQIQVQQKDLDEANADLKDLCDKHKVESTVDEGLAAVEARMKVLSAQLDKAKKEVAPEREVTKQKKTEQAEHDNFTKLSKDLTDARFVSFLLDNVQMTLSEIGSEHFQRLSSDRYRFSEDGKFDVIDLNYADQTRTSDTLSGGETFLASLGLALALAEMVGREGGRLDAFILDEGFGALDPEHLDLAMEGVERLVADSDRRLVMVVSHVAELRERVDDLLILEKDPATGDTKIVEGAGSV